MRPVEGTGEVLGYSTAQRWPGRRGNGHGVGLVDDGAAETVADGQYDEVGKLVLGANQAMVGEIGGVEPNFEAWAAQWSSYQLTLGRGTGCWCC